MQNLHGIYRIRQLVIINERIDKNNKNVQITVKNYCTARCFLDLV